MADPDRFARFAAVTMVAVVEIAAELGDRAVAREARDLLAPFAGRPVMPSLAVVCLGSAERSLTLAAGEAVAEPGPQDVLDDQARAAYSARRRDLGDELAEAEAGADRARAERLRVELDTLLDHLEEATGLHGRSRAFTHQAERARTAVRKAIKRALDLIDGLDPVVAEALRTTVTTRATCAYVPDRATPVTWST